MSKGVKHRRENPGAAADSTRVERLYDIHISRQAVIGVIIVLLAPWAIVIPMAVRQWWPASATPVAAAAPTTTAAEPAGSEMHKCNPGPWGNLEYCEIITQPPDEYISPAQFTATPLQWTFTNCANSAALQALLGKAGLTAEQRAVLERSAVWSAGRCVITPDKNLVISLEPATRARLYAELARCPDNRAQVDPFVFRKNDILDWLDNGALARPTVAMAKQLLYAREDRLLMADYGILIRDVSDAQERLRLLNVLLRRRAVSLRLRVMPDSVVDALVRYWGRGGQHLAVEPLLRSVPRVAGGHAVEVALLLPTFARERLYTYPTPSVSAQAASHDCHWSALNFFNTVPDERFSRPDSILATIQSDYFPLPGSPSFGDLAVFSSRECIVHSAVYIADDIVFTKNGASFTSPWLLMTVAEARASFPAYENLTVTYYRPKRLGG